MIGRALRIRRLRAEIDELRREMHNLSQAESKAVAAAATEFDRSNARAEFSPDFLSISEAIAWRETEIAAQKLASYDVKIPPSSIRPDFWTRDTEGNLNLSDIGLYEASRKLRSERLQARAFLISVFGLGFAAISALPPLIELMLKFWK